MKQDILIVGGGGREHTIAATLKKSPNCGKIYVAPGNGGTAAIAENLPIKATDVEGVVAAAKEKGSYSLLPTIRLCSAWWTDLRPREFAHSVRVLMLL